jgi:hypothetical protein
MEKTDKELIIECILGVKNELLAEINKIRKDLQGLIEIQQKLIHERLNVSVPPPPKEYGVEKIVSNIENNINYKITISQFGLDRIKITGKGTFDHKNVIKESGPARWEGELKFWSLPSSCTKTLINKFKDVGLTVDKDICVNVIRTDQDDTEEIVDESFNNSVNSFVKD